MGGALPTRAQSTVRHWSCAEDPTPGPENPGPDRQLRVVGRRVGSVLLRPSLGHRYNHIHIHYRSFDNNLDDGHRKLGFSPVGRDRLLQPEPRLRTFCAAGVDHLHDAGGLDQGRRCGLHQPDNGGFIALQPGLPDEQPGVRRSRRWLRVRIGTLRDARLGRLVGPGARTRTGALGRGSRDFRVDGRSGCPLTPGQVEQCPVRLLQSNDGGRTWATANVPSGPGISDNTAGGGQTWSSASVRTWPTWPHCPLSRWGPHAGGAAGTPPMEE